MGGPWPIDHTLHIRRSNVTIQGTPGNVNVILQRSPNWTTPGQLPQDASIMDIDNTSGPYVGITIAWLTIDGNRQNILTCAGVNYPTYDLNLTGAGTAGVIAVKFINAVSVSLLLDGTLGTAQSGSVVAFSYFAPDDPNEGARNTALFFLGNYTVAWGNDVYYAGTAGINHWSGA